MDSTIILHLGTGKTGTTAIQAFLRANKQFLESEGVRYLGNLAPQARGFPDYARYLQATQGDDFLYAQSDLSRVFHSCPKHKAMLYSNEIHYESVKVLRAYRVAIGSNPFKVVVYLRRQDEFLQAHYAQSVVDPTVRETLPIQEIAFNPDHYALLDTYSKIFGKNNIIVRVYEKSGFPNRDLFQDFFESCRLPWKPDLVRPNKSLSNESRSRMFIELLRIANSRLPEERHSEVVSTLEEYLGEKANKKSSDAYSFFTEYEMTAIMDRYSATNSLVAQEYLGRKDGTLFSKVNAARDVLDAVPQEDIQHVYEQVFGNFQIA